MSQPNDHLIPRAELKRRYSVCDRTIARWERENKLPKHAAKINGRRFYRLGDLISWEQEAALEVEGTS